MPFGFLDPVYMLVALPGLALALVAQIWVKSAFSRWSQVGAAGGMSGAECAYQVMAAGGAQGVRIEEVQGFLSDHYDPTTRTLRLSPQNYHGRSIAALGIAAHEAGHAVQHAAAYAPLAFRSLVVKPAMIGQSLSWILLIAGLGMGAVGLVYLGIALFSVAVLFTLVTLPVEFNASRRALLALEGGGILSGREMDGAREVLRAAALTYVAAAVTAVLQLLYFLWRAGLIGGSRRD
ncbi:MAG: zinc metallopeptidase [Planctomycetes bacterium]|nr:zinc metallopeptidase [Planctomycetota bacterium]